MKGLDFTTEQEHSAGHGFAAEERSNLAPLPPLAAT